MRESLAPQTKPIVVAVDGSPESENALRWATEHAEVMALPLRIITCYQRYYVTGESAGVSWEQFESTKHATTLQAREVIERVSGTDVGRRRVMKRPI